MPSKKLRLTVYLTQEEHAAISASAARAGVSLSTFAKRVCSGMPVPSLEHALAVKDMLRINATYADRHGPMTDVDVPLAEPGDSGEGAAQPA